MQDTTGDDVALHYVRTKDGREVDFALTRKGKAERLIEVKLSEELPRILDELRSGKGDKND